MIKGLSHITFIVSDLERTSRLLVDIFDASEVYDSGHTTHSIAREKFFLINGIWIAIMAGESLPEKTYHHVAFQIEIGHGQLVLRPTLLRSHHKTG